MHCSSRSFLAGTAYHQGVRLTSREELILYRDTRFKDIEATAVGKLPMDF